MLTQFRYQRLLLIYSALALLLVTSGAVFIGHRQSTEKRRLSALVEDKTTELHRLATRDELTGLHNRRHLCALLERQRAQHAESRRPMCVALLDIDFFKSFNDRHGHAMGDATLIRFAAVTTQTLRAADLLGHWGGEEFLLAFPNTSTEQAQQVLSRLREALMATNLTDLGSDLRLRFSGGLTLLDPLQPVSAAVARADQAMYRAKAAGRNRVEME